MGLSEGRQGTREYNWMKTNCHIFFCHMHKLDFVHTHIYTYMWRSYMKEQRGIV